MTTYNVHIYREMRLLFGGIEAETHESAASIARDKATDQADSSDDCDGETIAALVDVVGDEEYEQTRLIDFEPERQRKAAAKLLAALKDLLGERPSVQDFRCIRCGRDYHDIGELAIETGDCPSDDCPSYHARAAIAEAEAAGIRPEPVAPTLRAALIWLLDDIADAGQDRDPETGVEYDSVAFARAALANPGAADSPPAADPARKPYSVLLLYPDYANDGGTETYYAWVEAPDPLAAIALARRQAFAAQVGVVFPPDDFAVLLVTEGHHYGLPMSHD